MKAVRWFINGTGYPVWLNTVRWVGVAALLVVAAGHDTSAGRYIIALIIWEALIALAEKTTHVKIRVIRVTPAEAVCTMSVPHVHHTDPETGRRYVHPTLAGGCPDGHPAEPCNREDT